MSKFTFKWNEDTQNAWHVIQQKGRTRFILTRGVFGWGMLFAVLMTLCTIYILPGNPENKPEAILLLWVLAPLGGALWGYRMWNYMQKQYEKYEADRKKDEK